MVKGVNRTVIEVNDTGSKVFEKIVFFVSPQYGNLNAKSLQKAVNDLSLGLDDYKNITSLRNRMKKKRRNFIFSVSGALLLSIIGIILLIVLWI